MNRRGTKQFLLCFQAFVGRRLVVLVWVSGYMGMGKVWLKMEQPGRAGHLSWSRNRIKGVSTKQALSVSL